MGHNADNIFRWVSVWIICGVFLGILLLASEVGYRIAMRRRTGAPRASEDGGGLGTVLGALLGLLSLLLGFTYSYVVTRSETRKSAIVNEANAIGTAYLRAQLVPLPIGPQLQSVLREYLDTRIVADNIGDDPERLRQAIRHSEEVQSRIWPLLQRALDGRPETSSDQLLEQSINDVINLHTIRLAAARDHVPPLILWMLFVMAGVAIGWCGFTAGSAGARHFARDSIFALMIVVVTLIILDLDRPRSGFMPVSQQSLEDLRQSINQPGASANGVAPEVQRADGSARAGAGNVNLTANSQGKEQRT